MTLSPIRSATCACGRVEVKANGAPITSAVCYCDDCQAGGHRIEALPNAGAVVDPDGGTEYILYRKDRFACTKGEDLLKPYKLRDTSRTNRVVATCCNTAMFVNFEKGPHWVSAYRARFRGALPPLQFRMNTKFKADGVAIPNDAPSSSGYPLALAIKLVASRVAMLIGR